jgi:hypothetical protein
MHDAVFVAAVHDGKEWVVLVVVVVVEEWM